MAKVKNIVLVHGAWADGSSWSKVIPLLLLAATQGPTSAAKALGAPVSKVAWKTEPSWFVLSSEDHMVPFALQQAEVKKTNGTAITVKTGHASMLAQPEKIADLIAEAATKAVAK